MRERLTKLVRPQEIATVTPVSDSVLSVSRAERPGERRTRTEAQDGRLFHAPNFGKKVSTAGGLRFAHKVLKYPLASQTIDRRSVEIRSSFIFFSFCERAADRIAPLR